MHSHGNAGRLCRVTRVRPYPASMTAARTREGAGGAIPRWLRNSGTQRLVLGDRNPIVGEPSDVLRFALLIGSALLIFLDKNIEAGTLGAVLIVIAPRLLAFFGHRGLALDASSASTRDR